MSLRTVLRAGTIFLSASPDPDVESAITDRPRGSVAPVDKSAEQARAGLGAEGDAPTSIEAANARRGELETAVARARRALDDAQAALTAAEEGYRAARLTNAPADRGPIQAAEAELKWAQRDLEAFELAAAQYRGVWARAAVADLRAQAQRARTTATEAQAAINRLDAEILALQRRAGEHGNILSGAAGEAVHLEHRADMRAREYGLRR